MEFYALEVMSYRTVASPICAAQVSKTDATKYSSIYPEGTAVAGASMRVVSDKTDQPASSGLATASDSLEAKNASPAPSSDSSEGQPLSPLHQIPSDVTARHLSQVNNSSEHSSRSTCAYLHGKCTLDGLHN